MALERLETRITNIAYHSLQEWSDSGIPFLIAHTSSGVTIKGEIYKPVRGENYVFWGEWREDKTRGSFFYFYSFEILVNQTTPGLIDYLQRYVPNIGPARTVLLVERFGPTVLDQLRQDPSIALEIPGITKQVIEGLKSHFDSILAVDPVSYAAVYDIVADQKVPQSVVLKVILDFGSSAPDIIKENPYLLMSYPYMGWTKVDAIAVKKLGYPKLGLERFRAGVMECIKRAAESGDTCIEYVSLKVAMHGLLGRGPLDEAIESLRDDGLIEIEELQHSKIIADTNLASAERTIANRLYELTVSAPREPIDLDKEGAEGKQLDALKHMEVHPVSILTGPPGTGKTYTMSKAVSSFDGKTSISTPTGKAAKRVTEVIDPDLGIEISTIHRLLGVIGSGEGVGVPQQHAKFGRGRKHTAAKYDGFEPLDIDNACIDELSMVGTQLFASYLSAVPNGSRLLFSGDENQLASIEAGSVIRDMRAGGIPTAFLDEPRRNSGRIVLACHDIVRGKTPTPSQVFDWRNGENWYHYELNNPEDIVQEIIDLHARTKRNPLLDLQVISPQNAGLPIACNNLNYLLSRHFNARNHTEQQSSDTEVKFAIKDKVVRKKNAKVRLLIEEDSDTEFDITDDTFQWKGRNYEVGHTRIVNGDIGQIEDIFKRGSARYVIVRFRNPNKLCVLPYGTCELQLAYATTVHTFQGSGSPVVIAPVHSSFYWDQKTNNGLWSRELLYTLFSRAEQSLITVGSMEAIKLAVSRKTIHKRKTRLAERIRERFANIQEVLQVA